MQGTVDFFTNNNGRRVLTMFERSQQTLQVECSPVPHLMVEYEKLIWDLTFHEHFCRKAIWARHDVVRRFAER